MIETQITTVKEQGGRYLVDNAKLVPKTEDNIDYQEILKWIQDGGIVQDEFTEAELVQQESDKAKNEALKLLNDTDWYYIRQIDIGEVVPIEIVEARTKARELLNA